MAVAGSLADEKFVYKHKRLQLWGSTGFAREILNVKSWHSLKLETNTPRWLLNINEISMQI